MRLLHFSLLETQASIYQLALSCGKGDDLYGVEGQSCRRAAITATKYPYLSLTGTQLIHASARETVCLRPVVRPGRAKPR